MRAITVAFLMLAGGSQALACQPSDFKLVAFKPAIYDDCRSTPCPALRLAGEVENQCAQPAGVQIKITALSATGSVIDTIEGWPASTRNIAPGERYAFNMGAGMPYQAGMHSFDVQIIDARTWR